MWPWEHLAVGYLAYSLGLRALDREPPSDAGFVAVALASQLPDLVDKPLSWGLGWFPSGYALGHSLLVAVPVGALALRSARAHPRSRWRVAAVVGYWSHLAADVLNPVRNGDWPAVERVLWPFVDIAPYDADYGLGRGLVYVQRFLRDLAATDAPTVLVLYVLVPAAALGVWLLDGAPGLGLLARVRRALR